MEPIDACSADGSPGQPTAQAEMTDKVVGEDAPAPTNNAGQSAVAGGIAPAPQASGGMSAPRAKTPARHHGGGGAAKALPDFFLAWLQATCSAELFRGWAVAPANRAAEPGAGPPAAFRAPDADAGRRAGCCSYCGRRLARMGSGGGQAL